MRVFGWCRLCRLLASVIGMHLNHESIDRYLLIIEIISQSQSKKGPVVLPAHLSTRSGRNKEAGIQPMLAKSNRAAGDARGAGDFPSPAVRLCAWHPTRSRDLPGGAAV